MQAWYTGLCLDYDYVYPASIDWVTVGFPDVAIYILATGMVDLMWCPKIDLGVHSIRIG